MACLCAAGIGFLVWHYFRVHDALVEISPKRAQKGGGAELEQFFGTFRMFYLVPGVALAAVAAANLLSGILVAMRRWRLVSLAVACLNCVVVPVGTVLAALAVVVLLRDSVRRAYAAAAGARAATPPAAPA